jgi:DNA replication protein DnaC
VNCSSTTVADRTSTAKDLPYLDFLEQILEAESQAKHSRNVRLKTQWAHFPYNKGLDQFDFAFQRSVDERKLRELAGLAFLERKENVLLLGPPGVGKTHLAIGPRHGRDRGRLLGLLRHHPGSREPVQPSPR